MKNQMRLREVCEDIKPFKTHPTTLVDVENCDGN